jgi:hypothetical protein
VFASNFEVALLENQSVSLMLHQKEFLKDELKPCHTGVKSIFANYLGMTILKAGLQET